MREAASFFANQSSTAPAGVVTALLRDIRAAFGSWSKRRELARLSEFDDHMLADIGLSRQDLDWALHLPFAADPALELQRRSLRNRVRGWRF